MSTKYEESKRREFFGKAIGLGAAVGTGAFVAESFKEAHAQASIEDIVILENIAALRSSTITENGTGVAFVKSHTSEGDGGHGFFQADSGHSASYFSEQDDDDGIKVFPDGGDGSSIWRRIKTNTVIPEWFGAGQSGDATEKIQKAIDELLEHETLLFTGHYFVSDRLLVAKSNIRLRGDGGRLVQTSPAAPMKTLVLEGVDNVEICGIHLVGGGFTPNPDPDLGPYPDVPSTSHNGIAGIWIHDSTNCTVVDNYLENHAGGGIRWDSDNSSASITSNLLVARNRVVGVGDAFIDTGFNFQDVAIGSHSSADYTNIIVADNDISGHAFGIHCADNGGGSIFITGNYIHDIPGQHGIYLNPMSQALIANNYIRNVALIGIKNQIRNGSNIPDPIQQLTIKDNHIISVGIPNSSVTGPDGYAISPGTGISVEGNASDTKWFENTVVHGNTILNIDGRGIVMNYSKNNVVRDNVIKKCHGYGILGRRFGGNIANNHIVETSQNGIEISIEDELVLEGNTIVDACQNKEGWPNETDRAYYCYFSNPDMGVQKKLHLKYNNFRSVKAEHISLKYAFRSGPGVDVYAQKNDNHTSKSWFVEGNIKSFDMGFSKSVDFLAGDNSNPVVPVYGFGRRQLFGTQDPTSAGIMDDFDDGDICWNATPTAGGYVGWVCVIPSSPGNLAVWKPFGLISG